MNRLEYTVLYLQSIWPNTKIVLMALLPNMASIRWGALGGSVATVEAQHGSNLEAASQCAWAARPMFGTAAAQAQPPCDVPPHPPGFTCLLHPPMLSLACVQRVSVTAANREYKAMAARRGISFLSCGQVC